MGTDDTRPPAANWSYTASGTPPTTVTIGCKGCERRRREMTLMLEATRQWTAKPLGPNVHQVYLQLRADAVARGEFDGLEQEG